MKQIKAIYIMLKEVYWSLYPWSWGSKLVHIQLKWTRENWNW